MGIKSFLFSMFKSFEDSLYPELSCFICGMECEDKEIHLCEDCLKKFPYIKDNLCIKCGAPVNIDTKYCDDCRWIKYDFDQARAVFVYNDLTKNLLMKIKYNNAKYTSKFFAKVMVEVLKDWGISPDMIVPVPLAKNRMKKRGYNQSEIIADDISLMVGVPVVASSVERKETKYNQQNLKIRERFENMKNVFTLIDKNCFKDKIVLIVDDVFTTGATVNELSKEIRKGKPNKIYVLTAGKTLFDKSKN